MIIKREEDVKALAAGLMRDVYYPVTAWIWLNEVGAVVGIYQFDTLYCRPQSAVPDDTYRCFMISHHPDGSVNASAADERNWRVLLRIMRGRTSRLYTHSEDMGLIYCKDA